MSNICVGIRNILLTMTGSFTEAAAIIEGALPGVTLSDGAGAGVGATVGGAWISGAGVGVVVAGMIGVLSSGTGVIPNCGTFGR